MGLLAWSRPGPVEARVLLRVTADLGLSEGAARTTILRMRRQGMLRSEREGRTARYSLAPEVLTAQQRITDHFRVGPPAWDGAFAGLLHDFPERERAARDALRRAARLAGYGVLRPGLLVAPSDRWRELAGRFAAAEEAGRILRVRLEFSPADAARVARSVWGLDRLAERYREVVARTARALEDQGRAAGADALRRLEAVTRPIYEAVGDDAALPAALLPADWPGPELGRSLGTALAALSPAAAAYVRTL